MLDEELSDDKKANATECVDDTPKKRGNAANLKPFDSENGKEAALKRWRTKKFANVRNYIKKTMAEEIEKRAEAIAKANADFIEAGNLDGVRAVQEGLKGIGAHADIEERAMNMKMKVDG